MKLSIVLAILPLTLTACTTTKYVEVPVYPVILADRPESPNLSGLNWDYIPEKEYFVLTPEEFDKYRSNIQELDIYIRSLQEGWIYYESVSKPEPESGNTGN
jgi:hypothetical protein